MPYPGLLASQTHAPKGRVEGRVEGPTGGLVGLSVSWKNGLSCTLKRSSNYDSNLCGDESALVSSSLILIASSPHDIESPITGSTERNLHKKRVAPYASI